MELASSNAQARRYASAGSPIDGEFQVNLYTTFSQRFVDTASERKGGFVVTWSSQPQDASGSGVFGRRFGSDGSAIGGEFQINSYTDQNQGRSAVAIAPDGAFVVAWQSDYQDGYGSPGIFGQRFAAPPVCPEEVAPGCMTGFDKGLFLAKEKVAGKEKFIAKLTSAMRRPGDSSPARANDRMLDRGSGPQDYRWFSEQEPKTAARIDRLLADMRHRPSAGIGRPEPFRGALAGWWSRRITGEHCLVYRVVGKGATRGRT